MERVDFYRHIYDREVQRKGDLEKSLGMPISLIITMAAALFFLVTHFPYSAAAPGKVIFFSLAFLTTGSIIFTILNLIKAYNNFTFGYPYAYLPYCDDIEEYYQKLGKYISSVERSIPKRKERLQEEFDAFLVEQYIRVTDITISLNEKKQAYLFRAKSGLIISMMCLFLLALVSLINYISTIDGMDGVLMLFDAEKTTVEVTR